MRIFTLACLEFKKIKRSRILLLLLAASVILWIPSILHVHLNFQMQAEGISPEHNFFIQGFLGMSWFMFPASMVVATVLLSQTERANRGILKMLALPVRPAAFCLSKFAVLLVLAAAQIILMTGAYYSSAVICGITQHYRFLLPPLFAAKQAALLFLSSIPMLAFFWMLSVCIQTPIFSIGLCLSSIVPSVLVINTTWWFADPVCYPFFIMTAAYGKLAANLTTAQAELFPWIPAAILLTILFLFVSCIRFGQAERRSFL